MTINQNETPWDEENFIRLRYEDGSYIDLPKNKTAKLCSPEQALVLYRPNLEEIEERRLRLAAYLQKRFAEEGLDTV